MEPEIRHSGGHVHAGLRSWPSSLRSTELQAADRRRQAVITDLLKADYRRQRQLVETLKIVKEPKASDDRETETAGTSRILQRQQLTRGGW
ncbi:hypothetical protein Tco_1111232 [Tanacetum coccineum]|uniref:Uncharacterized protein n=1 Tax=Tanacetum coccineum TaxID=301880 RepID=A0ABQ5IL09_9ASTR